MPLTPDGIRHLLLSDMTATPKVWMGVDPAGPGAVLYDVPRVSLEPDTRFSREGLTLQVEMAADTAAWDTAVENVRLQILGALAGGIEDARQELERLVLGRTPALPEAEDGWSSFSGLDAMHWEPPLLPDEEEVPRWLA